MNSRVGILKLSIGFLGVLILLTGIEYGFGIFGVLEQNSSDTLQTGTWSSGTPIYTAQEFYDFATSPTSLDTDFYYLANDIDFTGFTWDYNSTYDTNAFRGIFDGLGYTLSNITLTSTDTSSVYMSLFTRLDGGVIQNVNIENYAMGFSSTYFYATDLQAGTIAGEVTGVGNIIERVTLTNVDVIGNSLNGAGGLVGQVQGNTDLTIKDIKVTGLTVLNTSKRAGGLISRVLKGTGLIIIEDIDLEGTVAADNKISNTGGLIGTLQDTNTTINRVIVEYTAEGTITLTDGNITMKSDRYTGGFIGNNRSNSLLIQNAFYTGTLYNTYNNLGSVIGRELGTTTLTNVFYSDVLFATTTTPPSGTGVNGIVVNATSMPNNTWWNSFATEFYSANTLWDQDVTGRLKLIR